MFDWWGPIIYEYYGGTELNGLTFAGPQDWLAHPGTVGRADHRGPAHLRRGRHRAARRRGRDRSTSSSRTASSSTTRTTPRRSPPSIPGHPNWTTLNDVGRVDEDGFLYLTDRATFMIISGGVNIYPQEIEDCLIMHPTVVDVAVIGVPNEDLGEEVKAVVQVAPGVEAGPRSGGGADRLGPGTAGPVQVPRSVDFIDEMPRLPTGKLYKRLLREQYWADKDSKLV